MNILRLIGFVAVMGLVGFGGIEIVERTAVPGFQGVIATAHAEVGRPLTPVQCRGCGASHGASLCERRLWVADPSPALGGTWPRFRYGRGRGP